MSTAVDTLLLMDSLAFAVDYIPKRALRFFTVSENRQETIALLLDEIKDVLEYPAEYLEEGSQILFYALVILGHFRAKEAMGLIREIGRLDQETIDGFMGERLFDSVSLAIAQIFSEDVPLLKELIEDPEMDECIRAACVQSMICLYGQEVLPRDELVSYLLYLLKKPREKVAFFYEVIVSSSLALHPEEMMEEIRKVFSEQIVDESDITLQDVEEFLTIDKEEVIREGKAAFAADLEDIVAHFESIQELPNSVERNELCPCGSGQKYKKCCH
jgi:hypothetical protein